MHHRWSPRRFGYRLVDSSIDWMRYMYKTNDFRGAYIVHQWPYNLHCSYMASSRSSHPIEARNTVHLASIDGCCMHFQAHPLERSQKTIHHRVASTYFPKASENIGKVRHILFCHCMHIHTGTWKDDTLQSDRSHPRHSQPCSNMYR